MVVGYICPIGYCFASVQDRASSAAQSSIPGVPFGGTAENERAIRARLPLLLQEMLKNLLYSRFELEYESSDVKAVGHVPTSPSPLSSLVVRALLPLMENQYAPVLKGCNGEGTLMTGKPWK